MKQNPLLTTLLDLDAELAGRVSLTIGGGYDNLRPAGVFVSADDTDGVPEPVG